MKVGWTEKLKGHPVYGSGKSKSVPSDNRSPWFKKLNSILIIYFEQEADDSQIEPANVGRGAD